MKNLYAHFVSPAVISSLLVLPFMLLELINRRNFQQSPKTHIEIEEIFGLGMRCVMRWKYHWADGYVRGVDIFSVADGLIAEKLSYVKGQHRRAVDLAALQFHQHLIRLG